MKLEPGNKYTMKNRMTVFLYMYSDDNPVEYIHGWIVIGANQDLKLGRWGIWEINSGICIEAPCENPRRQDFDQFDIVVVNT